MADRPKQSVSAASVDPFHSRPSDLASGFPRAEVFDHFRLEQRDDGFGQGIVVAVSGASKRNLDSGFGGVICMVARTMSQKQWSYA